MVRFRRLVYLAVLLGAVGCAHSSSVLVSGASPGQRVSSTRRSILWGLISSDSMWDPRAQCPNGVAKVEVSDVFSIIGFYASYDVTAWCSANAQGQAQAPGYGPPAGGGGSVIVIPR